jgi:hypothetical protein
MRRIALSLLLLASPAHALTITKPGTVLRDTTIVGDLNVEAHGDERVYAGG